MTDEIEQGKDPVTIDELIDFTHIVIRQQHDQLRRRNLYKIPFVIVVAIVIGGTGWLGAMDKLHQSAPGTSDHLYAYFGLTCVILMVPFTLTAIYGLWLRRPSVILTREAVTVTSAKQTLKFPWTSLGGFYIGRAGSKKFLISLLTGPVDYPKIQEKGYVAPCRLTKPGDLALSVMMNRCRDLILDLSPGTSGMTAIPELLSFGTAPDVSG